MGEAPSAGEGDGTPSDEEEDGTPSGEEEGGEVDLLPPPKSERNGVESKALSACS